MLFLTGLEEYSPGSWQSEIQINDFGLSILLLCALPVPIPSLGVQAASAAC